MCLVSGGGQVLPHRRHLRLSVSPLFNLPVFPLLANFVIFVRTFSHFLASVHGGSSLPASRGGNRRPAPPDARSAGPSRREAIKSGDNVCEAICDGVGGGRLGQPGFLLHGFSISISPTPPWRSGGHRLNAFPPTSAGRCWERDQTSGC